MLRTGLLLSGRRQKTLINNLLLPGRREEIHHVDRSVYRANTSQKRNQVYALPNQFFFIHHWCFLSSMHLFDMSSSSRSGSGRSVNCHDTSLVEASPASTGQQSTPADDDDHDIHRLSGQHSQIASTCSLCMFIYHIEPGMWKFAYPSSVSRTISDMLTERITSFWPVFSKVPSLVKDHWFEEFKALYEWEPSTSFVEVRRLWENNCRLKYNRIVSDMKRYNVRYTCITDEVWRQFVEYWESEDVKELANNILSVGKIFPTGYTYGYQVMTQLVNDMKKKFGRMPTYMEAYIQFHYVEKSDVSEDIERNTYFKQLVMSYNKRVAQVIEFLGRELSHDELNHLFIHFSWVRDASSSRKITHGPAIGNIHEINRDNTYNIKSAILGEREMLMRVQELNSKVDKLEKKISLLTRYDARARARL